MVTKNLAMNRKVTRICKSLAMPHFYCEHSSLNKYKQNSKVKLNRKSKLIGT